MNVALWIVAGLLAALFLFAGITKAGASRDKLASKMPWVEDFSTGTIRFIGVVEALGAIGLIVPPLVGIAPVLAPLAATGLAITMALAIVVHIRRKESQAVVMNLVLMAAAIFVAWGRFGPYAF